MLNETKIIADKISTKFFPWYENTRTFLSEASDLPKGFNPQSQIWNDSADLGFVLVSEKSDHKLLFTFVGNDYDSDGDVDGWLFKATQQLNKLLDTDVDLLIIND